MNKAITIAIAAAAAILAAAFLYCWYNKDRYQYIHYVSGRQAEKCVNSAVVILDKNTGTVYEGASKIDYPSAKTTIRKFDVKDAQ